MLIEFDVPTRTRPATTPLSCCTRSTPASSSWKARAAWASDAARLAAIWNHEVRTTTATTDTETRDAAAQRAWLAAHTERYPVVVAVVDDVVAGYAALTAYRQKPAFDRTVEDSIYV